MSAGSEQRPWPGAWPASATGAASSPRPAGPARTVPGCELSLCVPRHCAVPEPPWNHYSCLAWPSLRATQHRCPGTTRQRATQGTRGSSWRGTRAATLPGSPTRPQLSHNPEHCVALGMPALTPMAPAAGGTWNLQQAARGEGRQAMAMAGAPGVGAAEGTGPPAARWVMAAAPHQPHALPGLCKSGAPQLQSEHPVGGKGQRNKVIYIMCLPAEPLMAGAFVLQWLPVCDGQEAAVSLCSTALFSNLDPS